MRSATFAVVTVDGVHELAVAARAEACLHSELPLLTLVHREHHGVAFLFWFLVEAGVAMSVASTSRPSRSARPRVAWSALPAVKGSSRR